MEVDGENVIYFTQAEWIALSKILWDDRVQTAERTAEVAVLPLQKEIQKLEKQKKRMVVITIGAGSVAALSTVFFLLK